MFFVKFLNIYFLEFMVQTSLIIVTFGYLYFILLYFLHVLCFLHFYVFCGVCVFCVFMFFGSFSNICLFICVFGSFYYNQNNNTFYFVFLAAFLTTKTITIAGSGFTACLQPKQKITQLIIIY